MVRLIAIVFVIMLAGCSKQGWVLPVMQLNSSASIDKEILNAANLQGKLLYINYWAEWCKPCVKEIPELNRFARQYQQQVVVLAVNFDHLQGAALQQAISKAGIAYPYAESLNGSPFAQYGAKGLPTTLVFNAEGKLLAKKVGPQTVASLAQAIAHYKDSSQGRKP